MAPNVLYRHSTRPAPPADLLGRILKRVEEKRAASWRFKVMALITAAVASVAALCLALYVSVVSFASSGAPAFLKLAVTDTGIVLAHWQDFAYTLLETIPAGGLAVALALTVIVAIALRALLRVVRDAHRPQRFTF